MQVEVTGLEEGRMPERYSVDGKGHTPPVRWRDVPDGARELLILMETVGAGGELEFTHWVAWGIDPSLEGLGEGYQGKPDPQEPPGMRQGTTSAGQTGYEPPVGTLDRTQRLRIRLIALDAPLDLPAAATVAEVHEAIAGRVVAEASTRFDYVRAP